LQLSTTTDCCLLAIISSITCFDLQQRHLWRSQSDSFVKELRKLICERVKKIHLWKSQRNSLVKESRRFIYKQIRCSDYTFKELSAERVLKCSLWSSKYVSELSLSELYVTSFIKISLAQKTLHFYIVIIF